MPEPLPLIVLAGSDRRRGSVPAGLAADDMLHGYKGAIRLPDGRPLVAEVIDRFRRSGRFRDPVLVGPARVYGDIALDCRVVDSDGPLSDTLRAALAAVTDTVRAGDAVAFTACDILPSAEELTELMAEAYDPVAPSAFWTQLVEARSEDMATSGWKPAYRLLDAERRMLQVYPGHVAVVRPQALRFEIMFRVLELAYRYRNRPLWQRAIGMTARGMGVLARADLDNALRGAPTVHTLSIPWHCAVSYLHYRLRRLEVSELERTFARVFLHRGARRAHGVRPVVFSITRTRSLARDIDTRAELEELMPEGSPPDRAVP